MKDRKKTVILTGSTGGLGRQLAHQILKTEDMHLIPVYRNQEKFDCCFTRTCVDGYMLSENENFSDICKLIPPETEELFLVLNSFSIMPIKHIGDYSNSEIETMIDADIFQPVRIINILTGYVNEHHIDFRIINLDSGAADFPLMGWGNYCASKAYLNAFLNVLRLENSRFRIVSIDPGVMDTDMQKNIRNTSESVFDNVEIFRKYKADGLLKNPTTVADYIISKYLISWQAVSFREVIE